MLLFTAEENEGVSQSHPRHSEQKVYGSADVSKEQPAAYLRECMRAEGWPLRDACLDKRHMWGVFPNVISGKKDELCRVAGGEPMVPRPSLR